MEVSQNAKILAVDDDKIIGAVLKKILVTEGYDVVVAQSGEEGLEKAMHVDPDLILLDVVLPGQSGIDVCKRLRMEKNTRETPILMVTSLNSPEDVVQGLRAGANDYVSKPFNADELRARVATQLRNRKVLSRMVQIEKALSLGRITAGLCHEINNPLHVVMGRMEMLMRQPLDEKQKRHAELALENCRRIQKLIKAMREYAEPVVHSKDAVNLNTIIESAVSIASLTWGEKKIDLEKNLLEPAPAVIADREKLQQVFINLITNAEQVMPNGGVLQLTTRISEENPNQVVATVSDTGKGIAKENLEKIFDPFFTTKENWTSPGLGLSVARRIVEELEGRIEAASEEGRGATLIVTLPMAPSS